MTKEKLIEIMQSLDAQRQELEAKLNFCRGGIRMCETLIEELEKEESSEVCDKLGSS